MAGAGGGGGDMGGGGGNTGGGITVGGADEESAPSESDVAIIDFAFQPSATFVDAGTTVEWVNDGEAPHTVTSDAAAFDSGTIGSGGSYSETFDTAGIYAYHCSIHPNMRGMVIVS